MSKTNILHSINWGQVITSLFIGAVFGGIALIRFSDSQAIVVSGHTTQIAELKEITVPRSEYQTGVENTNARLDRIESKVDRLLEQRNN